MTPKQAGEDTGEFLGRRRSDAGETLEQTVWRNRDDIDNHHRTIHGDIDRMKENPGLVTRVDRLEGSEVRIDKRLQRIEELLARIFWTIAFGALTVIFYTVWLNAGNHR